MIVICREFKWTVQEYLDTPAEIIDMIQQMLYIEADEIEQATKRAERKSRK